MFKLVVKNQIAGNERRLVEKLIFDVWSFEQSSTFDVEILANRELSIQDPLDRNAKHVLVFKGAELVGYGRLTLFLNQQEFSRVPKEVHLEQLNEQVHSAAFLSRLVVHPTARGLGLASLIDEERISIAQNLGVEYVLGCAVGEKRQKALNSSGFVIESEINSFTTPWYRTSRIVKLMKLKLVNHSQQKSLSI